MSPFYPWKNKWCVLGGKAVFKNQCPIDSFCNTQQQQQQQQQNNNNSAFQPYSFFTIRLVLEDLRGWALRHVAPSLPHAGTPWSYYPGRIYFIEVFVWGGTAHAPENTCRMNKGREIPCFPPGNFSVLMISYWKSGYWHFFHVFPKAPQFTV